MSSTFSYWSILEEILNQFEYRGGASSDVQLAMGKQAQSVAIIIVMFVYCTS